MQSNNVSRSSSTVARPAFYFNVSEPSESDGENEVQSSFKATKNAETQTEKEEKLFEENSIKQKILKLFCCR